MQAGKVADAAEPFSGHWLVTADLHGTPIYGRLDIEQQGPKITGEYYGDKFEGSLDGGAIHFVAKDNSGGTRRWTQRSRAACYRPRSLRPTGPMSLIPTGIHSQRYQYARNKRGAPVHHEFAPSVFYREFSASNNPVMSVGRRRLHPHDND